MRTRWLAWTLLVAAAPIVAGCTGKPRPRGDAPATSAERPAPPDAPGGRRGPRLAAVRGDYSLEQTRDNIRRDLRQMVERFERNKQSEDAMHVQAWAMQADIHLAASKAREEAGDIEGALQECYAAVQPPMGPGGQGGPGGPEMRGGPGGPGMQGGPGGPDQMREQMKRARGEMEQRMGQLKEEMRGMEKKAGGGDMNREQANMIRERHDALQGEAENLRREMERLGREMEGGGPGRGGPDMDGARRKIEERIGQLKDEMRGLEKKASSEEINKEQRQMIRKRRAELEEEMKNLRNKADKMDGDRGGRDEGNMMFEFGGPDGPGPQGEMILIGPDGERRVERLGGPDGRRDGPQPPRAPEPPGRPGARPERRPFPPPPDAGRGPGGGRDDGSVERREFRLRLPEGREGGPGPDERTFEYKIEVEPGREPRFSEGCPFQGGPGGENRMRPPRNLPGDREGRGPQGRGPDSDVFIERFGNRGQGPSPDFRNEMRERIQRAIRGAIDERLEGGARPEGPNRQEPRNREEGRNRNDERGDRPGDEFGRWAQKLGEQIGNLAREWQEDGGPDRMKGLREQIEKAVDQWREGEKESRARREKKGDEDDDEDKPRKKDEPKKDKGEKGEKGK